MDTQISAESQAVLDQMFHGNTLEEQRAALAQLPSLPDRDTIAETLTQELKSEKDDWRRSWILSALAAINRPGAVDIVAKYIDARKEKFEWARYWAVLGLSKMQPPDLKKHLSKALRDPSPLVHAVALRALIENGHQAYGDDLLSMMEDPDWFGRLAACKALRRVAGHRPLTETVEAWFIPRLTQRLLDPDESIDCRYQAALALGDIHHQWPDAIRALSRVFEDGLPNDWVRRTCVDALRGMGKPEIKAALLLALQDADAEIRVRAAGALKEVLETPGAVAFIVEHLQREDVPPRHYIQALNEIDHSAAVEALKDLLIHPDPAVASRATRALAELGGEEAVRALHALRREAITDYTKLLGDADKQIMLQFDSLMRQAVVAFKMSMWMHGLIFGIGVAALAAGLYVALSGGLAAFERFIGAGTAAGSVGTLLLVFYRGPLKDIRRSVINLVKVNVVFLGYVRQINQIDATFKQAYLSGGGSSRDLMTDSVREIREAVQTTMEQVKANLADEWQAAQ